MNASTVYLLINMVAVFGTGLMLVSIMRVLHRCRMYAAAAKMNADRSDKLATELRVMRVTEGIDKFLADPESGNLMKRPLRGYTPTRYGDSNIPPADPTPVVPDLPPLRPIWTGETTPE